MRGGRPVRTRAIVALLALAAALPVAPSLAHAASAGGAQAAGGQVLGEYRTRAEARAAAAEARRRGLRVAVREVARARTLYRVRLGPFPSRREALAVAGRLREAGVPHVVRRVPGARGHEISLGAYASERRARAVGERVSRRLHLRGLRVVPVRVEERRYAVVRLPPPRPAGRRAPAAAPAPAPTPAAPAVPRREAPAAAAERAPAAASAAAPPGPRVFASRRRAEAHAAKLVEEGWRDVRVEPRRERVTLHAVILRVYQRWADAQRAARRARGLGLPARVVRDRWERGYMVVAGAYRDAARARRALRRLRGLGFRNVRIVPTRVRRTLYAVLARPPVPEVAEAPPPAEAPAPEAVPPDVLVFAGAEPLPAAAAGGEEAAAGGPEGLLWLEAGGFTDGSASADSWGYARLRAGYHWQPAGPWEAKLAVRADGYRQWGGADMSEGAADYDEAWVRWRRGALRLTAGAQRVVWGRVDEIPPLDRLSVPDLRRFVLDELADRRLTVAALRAEWFAAPWKLDALVVPRFRPAELPDRDSVWHPVDRRAGRLLGVKDDAALAALVRGGSFGEDDDGAGGGGLRLTRTGRGVDLGLALIRARRVLPYYELDAAARAVLLGGGTVAAALAAAKGDTFTARHPWQTVAGFDLAVARGTTTWRLEAAWSSDEPVTRTDLSMGTVRAVDWVAGVELYPGGGDARVNLQLSGHHLLDAGSVLDRTRVLALGGSLEDTLAHGRWRLRLRFSTDLERRDYYLNPEVAFLGWEPHELYLAAHVFEGDGSETAGGFMDRNDLVTVGLRARF